MTSRTWLDWHEAYEIPGSSLARRLVVVQQYLMTALTDSLDAPCRLLSLCAGDGRDVLPVLAAHPAGQSVRAVLVEIDPELSRRARSAADALGLPGVEVRTADAGDPVAYRDAGPADVLLACGVFGNISTGDVRRTVAALPSFLKPGGVVIWTRGRGAEPLDPSSAVRSWFTAEGFEEIAFAAPADASFRVGMARLSTAEPTATPSRLFTFR
jgi:SAM-dependent methyltransferase